MHTPDGTLERALAPIPYSTVINTQPYAVNVTEEVLPEALPHVISLPNKDDNLTNSVLRLQSQLSNFSLHKSTSEPAMVVINSPPTGQDSSPDTPQPGYDPNKGWFYYYLFGCFSKFSINVKGAETRNAPDDWEIPFERITDLNFLGSGGQGTVFSGMLNNEPVAVKKVLDIKATDIKNLRKLNHRNIVKFKGVCTQAPCFSIIMEFCPYGPLFDLLKKQKNVVTTNRVVSWAKQIASGMQYVHSHKIIHRDLKSPNVLIGEEEIIKISDFGTSRSWSGVSEKMSFGGTVQWMAPEALQELECSEKVDVWSFGVVLWELLTCEVPYDGMEQTTIMYLVGSGKLRPPIPKSCPRGFTTLMETCWMMKAQDRPSFNMILRHLQLYAVEILGYEDTKFFETQESWKEEIKSQITQFKAQLQKQRIEFQLKEEQLIKKRETEIKHVRDIRELYNRKLEKVEQLRLELANILVQVQQYRQGGRKRDTQSKKRIINPFVKKIERRRCSQSTTPTSPDRSLTSPDSPQTPPAKAPLYAELNTVTESVVPTTHTCNTKFRKRHHRTNSGSPRNSASLRAASFRSSSGVDAGTQTDTMDLSETDLSPSTAHSPTKLKKLPQRVILQELRNESDDEGINGNSVQLLYMAQHQEPAVQVFTRVESRSVSPHCYDDTLNSNSEPHRDYSDEDNLETIGRKVLALTNANIFSDMRISTENGNVTAEIGEVIRRSCSETRNGPDSTEDTIDSFTDEEGESFNNLRRRSLARRPIYPGRRSSRYKHSARGSHQREPAASDEGNTSEYSVSPSSKSLTLESNPDRTRVSSNPSMKRPNNRSDGSSDSESDENVTIVTQVPFNINKSENVV